MKQHHRLPATLLSLLLAALNPAHTTASPAPAANPVQVQVQTVTVQTITVTAAPNIPSTAPQFTNTALFTSAVLNSTNFYRREHNASAVSWNDTLASYASSYLSSMGSLSPDSGSECDFAHSGGPYGENLAIGCGDVTGCVGLWGDEREEYDFDNPGFSEETGHFTQLVWKDTTAVGCGRRLCGERAWYLVCEYWPRGNVIGEFGEEVGRNVDGDEADAPGDNGMWSWAPISRPAGWSLYVTVVLIILAL
ncbi:hypothetical protein VPNG_07195 [Cytospora leucostoma]|uniref:SCP domain-containing protein n=1 Tax=Cytospora leucostoma TaxID=1230097 RepID=A0A423WJR2_9PEZI|nr:hypothetical protein VPNG_07195 [Cytospora leucostoma]